MYVIQPTNKQNEEDILISTTWEFVPVVSVNSIPQQKQEILNEISEETLIVTVVDKPKISRITKLTELKN